MKKMLFPGLLVAFLVTLGSCNSNNTSTTSKKVKLKTQIDSVSYALGVNVASWAKTSGLDEIETDALVNGFQDVMDGKDVKITNEKAQPIIQAYMIAASKRKGEKNLEEAKKFLEENGKKEGVITTASGLQYQVIKEGTGPQPTDTSTVTVNYHGTLIDGTVFDSSIDRGKPATFPLNGVIKGWTEGLQLMRVGSKYKFFIPPELAYGANPRPGGPIEPNMLLIFEIDLLSIGK